MGQLSDEREEYVFEIKLSFLCLHKKKFVKLCTGYGAVKDSYLPSLFFFRKNVVKTSRVTFLFIDRKKCYRKWCRLCNFLCHRFSNMRNNTCIVTFFRTKSYIFFLHSPSLLYVWNCAHLGERMCFKIKRRMIRFQAHGSISKICVLNELRNKHLVTAVRIKIITTSISRLCTNIK